MKECTTCKEYLDADSFYSSNWSECISCINEKRDVLAKKEEV